MKKEIIFKHAKIMLSGFLRTMYGAATAGLVALSVYGFAAIPTEGGYVAVCEFIVALATMGVALCSMYALGNPKRKGGIKKKGRFAA